MAARIVVDLDSPIPPYEQIRQQITLLVGSGQLTPGTRLPTVRALAADLGVAAGTVARAYRELESAGVVSTARRSGTTVAKLPASAVTVPPQVSAAVEHLISEAKTAGLDADRLTALVRGAFEATR
ncbi:GntR family transcriptional regulator [Pseudarthrobacter sp. J1738]|uniref:GntR family transcriptional regulator n=1 Tax=Pseudarthrobacter sp. J1738 TaxID=3420446 RepID=UPI003D2E6E4C